jgi:glycerol kinase
MLSTIAWQLDGVTTYAIEGSVFVAGAIVQWLRDGLGIITSSADVEALARTVDDSGGVTLVPALTGLGAPHWRPEARGVIHGLTRGTERGHIARAALEGIAFQVRDLIDAMEADSGLEISELRVDGGATANALLMQFQADLLNARLLRPAVLDTTALGAAYLAALGAGILSESADVAALWQFEKAFDGQCEAGEIGARVARWAHVLAKA